MEANNDIDSAEAVTESASYDWRSKLKVALHYAMLAFAPTLAVVALVIALLALLRQPAHVPAADDAARVGGLEVELAATKADLETTRVALARERSVREEDRKESGARDAKLIHAISELQTKMKISPTLYEQLRASSAIAPSSSTKDAVPSVAASAPAAVSAVPHTEAVAPKAAAQESRLHEAARVSETPTSTKKPSASSSNAKEEKKHSPQVQSLKEAIEQMNKMK